MSRTVNLPLSEYEALKLELEAYKENKLEVRYIHFPILTDTIDGRRLTETTRLMTEEEFTGAMSETHVSAILVLTEAAKYHENKLASLEATVAELTSALHIAKKRWWHFS